MYHYIIQSNVPTLPGEILKMIPPVFWLHCIISNALLNSNQQKVSENKYYIFVPCNVSKLFKQNNLKKSRMMSACPSVQKTLIISLTAGTIGLSSLGFSTEGYWKWWSSQNMITQADNGIKLLLNYFIVWVYPDSFLGQSP